MRRNSCKFIVVERESTDVDQVLHAFRQTTDVLPLNPQLSDLGYLHELLAKVVDFVVDKTELP